MIQLECSPREERKEHSIQRTRMVLRRILDLREKSNLISVLSHDSLSLHLTTKKTKRVRKLNLAHEWAPLGPQVCLTESPEKLISKKQQPEVSWQEKTQCPTMNSVYCGVLVGRSSCAVSAFGKEHTFSLSTEYI